MLDLIEVVLNRNGMKMQRIDGSQSLPQRRDALKAFREDSECLVSWHPLTALAAGMSFPFFSFCFSLSNAIVPQAWLNSSKSCAPNGTALEPYG